MSRNTITVRIMQCSPASSPLSGPHSPFSCDAASSGRYLSTFRRKVVSVFGVKDVQCKLPARRKQQALSSLLRARCLLSASPTFKIVSTFLWNVSELHGVTTRKIVGSPHSHRCEDPKFYPALCSQTSSICVQYVPLKRQWTTRRHDPKDRR
jgi:hypothetical protein